MMEYHFLNCDWGTSRFRLRLIQAPRGKILCERTSEDGAARLMRNASSDDRDRLFGSVLDRYVNEIATELGTQLRGIPVVISGMASSSIGWRELPYATLPFALDGRDLVWQRLEASQEEGAQPIYLLSGVRADLDVMRGEEVELMGLGVLLPELMRQQPSMVVLPGTHSKHVSIADGRIVRFETFMTGELYDLLSTHSSLRHPGAARDAAAPEGNAIVRETENQAMFAEGVLQSQQRALSAALFQVRVRQLLEGHGPDASAALLSGILIGSELATLARRPLADGPIVLCAGSHLRDSYRLACEVLGLEGSVQSVPSTDVERLSALGQWAALQQLLSTAK